MYSTELSLQTDPTKVYYRLFIRCLKAQKQRAKMIGKLWHGGIFLQMTDVQNLLL